MHGRTKSVYARTLPSEMRAKQKKTRTGISRGCGCGCGGWGGFRGAGGERAFPSLMGEAGERLGAWRTIATPHRKRRQNLHKSLAICIVAVLYCRYPHPHPTRHHLTNLRTRASTTTRTCVCHPLPSEQSKRGVERRNHLLAGTFLRTRRSTMFPVATTLLASRFEELHSAVLLMADQAGTPKRIRYFYFYILLSSPSR